MRGGLLRTVRGVPAAYKQAWMPAAREFTAEMNYVPEDGALQFTLPGGSSVALSYEDMRSFIQAIESQRTANGQ